MFRKLLFCLSAVALMASCTEEDFAWTAGTSELPVVLPENDLTFGYNSIITETDSLTSVRIPLNTDVPAAVSCRDGYADLQCVEVDGKYYLQIAHPEKAKLGVDKVTLTVKGHPELTKSFLFTINKSLTTTRAAAADDPKAPVKSRFADVFSVGQFLWEGATDRHPDYPMFKAKALFENDLIVLDPQFEQKTESDKFTGTSLEEHAKNWSIGGGMSNIPIANCLFGLTGSFSHKSVSKNYYEYMTWTKNNKAAGAKLDLHFLTIPAHSEEWKKYISDALDDVLNNEGSDLYKSFPTTDEGACKIIELFGSHLLTACVLGSNATLEFRKKQDLTQTSMELALDATLKVKRKDEIPNSDLKDWSDVIVADKIASQRKSFNLNFSYSTSDYVEETECEIHTKLVGGNLNTATDFEDWKPTDDPEKWVPVKYRQNDNDTVFVRAIYEFCQNADSKRCQSLKHVMEDVDEHGICPFIKHISEVHHIDLYPKETEWVLADVYVDVNAGREDTDHPYPQKWELPNGGFCTMYPYTDLKFNEGRCLDTETGNFGHCVRYKSHYWYYAMAMRDDCPGLEDIRLVKRSQVTEYQNKGYHKCLNAGSEDFGDGWSCNEKNDYVLMAKAIVAGDNKTTPITGMRLEGWQRKDKTGDNCLIGVSGATGPTYSGKNTTTVYDHYWNGLWKRYRVKDVLNQDDNVSPVYQLALVHQSWYLFLSTTNEPIRKEDARILETPKNMMFRK